ncbi:glycosyltransferase family 4 protein [Aridibaculum aurantiacum]|uniref:glycosyltransferase family 4 protein n=1 Tax=Aridibaculum aurantiacum TaxID=2810307 RepID=UPI001A972BCC|nr:glycosyltransferase family 4 protein [Aridibaculum aurantiacum]
MRKIVFVGLLPPVVNGQAIATDRILKHLVEKHPDISVLPIPDHHEPDTLKGKLQKVFSFACLMIKFIYKSGISRKIIYLSGARSVIGFYRNMPFILWSSLWGHKTILHFHCGDYSEFLSTKNSLFKLLNKKIYSLVDRVIILGESIKPSFTLTPSLGNRIKAVPYGVPLTANIYPKKLPETADEKIHLLFLSNLIESKGYLDVLAAVRILVHEYDQKNIICHFCGAFMSSPEDDDLVRNGDPEAYFYKLIHDYNVDGNVIFHGVVGGEKKETLLSSAHFFLLPTNYRTEGQPVSILEAMSYGQVVISTRYRAIPDMVLDNSTGFLVPYGSPADIALKIRELVDEPAVYHAMSSKALQHVHENFKLESHLQQVYKVFQEVA